VLSFVLFSGSYKYRKIYFEKYEDVTTKVRIENDKCATDLSKCEIDRNSIKNELETMKNQAKEFCEKQIADEMKRVYQTIQKNNPDIEDKFQFLSFSIDPENDSPSELKKYKTLHNLQYSNWDFLTGDEASTHQLGIQNFLTFAGKDEASAGGYAHSGSFTLVDSKGFVRGVYAVTNFDLSVNEQEFNRMVNEINILLDE
jgi:protein SCO1/2